MQGSKLLKVAGILMIIGGALGIILAIVAMVGIGVLAAMGASSGILWVSGILALVGGILELIAGIIGTKNWAKPEKATTCIVWGCIVICLSIVSSILSAIGGNFSIASLLLGLVLPVLYLIGAFQLKKAA